MRARVLDFIKTVDAEEPGNRGLWEWAREVGDKVSLRCRWGLDTPASSRS